ncbi:hypothetical protein KCP73_09125 [Salmonella enterica subsp. enterica]|nr:hypothetical protein KCP73_09125 [Salmonella enterica subsp. enterica]
MPGRSDDPDCASGKIPNGDERHAGKRGAGGGTWRLPVTRIRKDYRCLLAPIDGPITTKPTLPAPLTSRCLSWIIGGFWGGE